MNTMRMVLFLMVLAALASGEESRQEEDQKRDAFYWNSLVGRGVNLGNALDAPEEGQWGVRLEENYFDLIASVGFKSVRIPVRWSAHAGTAPPYAVDKEFLARVDWAIEQALSRELVAIVNIHHYEELCDAPDAHKERFLALWKQLAEHYSSYPPTLYFELLNEPCEQLTNDLWNAYLGEAIRVVRKSNPTRAVVVGPTHWNNISQLKNLKLPRSDKNIIVTFHYYEPFRFTHQGASWAGEESKAWVGTEWTATETEKNEIISHLDQAVRWSKENRRPLYMGEFGANSKADMASRCSWTRFVRSEAEKRNISWAYWEFCAVQFGVYDPAAKKWRKVLLKALLPESRTD